MAILNTLEGPAHVEVEKDGLNWSGYILLEDDPMNIPFFDITGPKSRCVYEGPVFSKGKYHFASGQVRIQRAHYTPEQFRVDFKGTQALKISKTFEGKPADYVDSVS